MAGDFSFDKMSLLEPETGEQTIRRVLSSYDLGKKLQHLRLRKKLGLVELGKHTGLSPSMLSQLENGKLVPTLPTLARIAMVFDVGLDHFFAAKSTRTLFSVIRASERIKFPERPNAPMSAYNFECLAFSAQDKSLQAYLAEFPMHDAKKELPTHFHLGAEFLYILQGSLIINCQDEDHELFAGDSVYFDASEPHSYRGTSPEPAKAVVITTPPRA